MSGSAEIRDPDVMFVRPYWDETHATSRLAALPVGDRCSATRRIAHSVDRGISSRQRLPDVDDASERERGLAEPRGNGTAKGAQSSLRGDCGSEAEFLYGAHSRVDLSPSAITRIWQPRSERASANGQLRDGRPLLPMSGYVRLLESDWDAARGHGHPSDRVRLCRHSWNASRDPSRTNGR